MKARGNNLVMKREGHLDQAGDPGRDIQMADIGLHGPERAKLSGVGAQAKRLCQTGDLDRVTQRSCGAVRFHATNGFRIDPGKRVRHGDHVRLAFDARRPKPTRWDPSLFRAAPLITAKI